MTYQQRHQEILAAKMRRKLLDRIFAYALKHKQTRKWKSRLYGLSYSASLDVISRIK